MSWFITNQVSAAKSDTPHGPATTNGSAAPVT